MGRPRGSTTYDHDRIVLLYKSGVPSVAIARRLGCSRRTVNSAIKKYEDKIGKEAPDAHRHQ